MTEWWAGLSVEQQVYAAIACIATVLVVVQTLLLFVGDLAAAGDADFDGPGDHPSGIGLVSTRTVVGFLAGLGWAGVVAAGEGGSPMGTAVVAIVVGLLFAAAIFYLMRFLYDLRHSGTLDYANALGEIGTVYLPIPAAMQGTGRIQVMVQGRLKEIQAQTRDPDRIENRTRVRVVELLDENTLVVEALADRAPSQED